VDVARAAMHNVAQLYGQAVAERVEDASAELEELVDAAGNEKEEAEVDYVKEGCNCFFFYCYSSSMYE